MDLQDLKRKKREVAKEMKRLNKRRRIAQGILCKLNGEYTDLKCQYESLDREIAEHYVEVCPPKRERKSPIKKEKKNSELVDELEGLTPDQIAMLKAMVEKEVSDG